MSSTLPAMDRGFVLPVMDVRPALGVMDVIHIARDGSRVRIAGHGCP
jgi:hypothetical protein